MKKAIFSGLLLASGAILPALAQEAETEVEITSPTATLSSEAEPGQADKSPSVPKLNIVWDCGECEHNDKVPPLIEQAYAAQAHENSFTVSETDVAEVAITDIRQRPPGVRVMFGFMAGKDRISLRIRHNGAELSVSDTSANAVMGLNHLSESVGTQAFEQLSQAPRQ